MKKGTKNLMMFAALGGLFWYFIRTGRRPPVPEQAVAAAAAQQRAALMDSMGPGTIGPAINGIAKDGQGLSCIGCY